MDRSRVTFVVGVSEHGLPCVIRVDRCTVGEYQSVALAKAAIPEFERAHEWVREQIEAASAQKAKEVQP